MAQNKKAGNTETSEEQKSQSNNPSPENTNNSSVRVDEEEFIVSEQPTQVGPQVTNATGSSTPLDNPTKNRDYSKVTPPAGIDTDSPIAEPVVQPQSLPMDPLNIPNAKEIKQENQQQFSQTQQYATNQLGEKDSSTPPANPAVTTMSPKEKKDNLDMTVDTAIYYYAELKLFIAGLFTFSETKMIAMEARNELRADWAILVDKSTNEVLTLRAFLKDANQQILKCAETSNEFKEKLRPILRAEFERRGWIISPQQNAMALIGYDLFNFGKNMFTINNGINEILKNVKNEYEDVKNGQVGDRYMYNQSLNHRIVEKEEQAKQEMAKNPVQQQPDTQQVKTDGPDENLLDIQFVKPDIKPETPADIKKP